MRSTIALAALAFLLAPIESLVAQRDALGAVAGTIHEPSSFRSVKSTRVSVRREGSDTTIGGTVAPDTTGRFRLDSLPPGRYRARVLNAALDALHVTLPASEVQVEAGRVATTDFTIPAGTALREAVCGTDRLPERTAAVAGRAIDADADDRPLVAADLMATWMEFPAGRSSGGVVPTKHVVTVKTGQSGEYRLCGVPTETLFTLQLRSRGRASAVVRLNIADDEGAVARNLSLSVRTGATIAALDSVAASGTGRDGATGELQLDGAAELSGTVRGLSGEPFVGAQVHVRHARASALTDSAGHFALVGLPAGTQMLVVRHPGYTLSELPVELRPGKRIDQPVLLVRPVTLDALKATAGLEAFDASRRTNPYGQFLTQEQIDKKKYVMETADLFDDLLGFSVFGRGKSARVISNMALANHLDCSEASVVIQGVQGRRINDVTPSQIAGIEVYADASFVPGEFVGRGDCGVVVIWVRKSTRPTLRAQSGLRADGYP